MNADFMKCRLMSATGLLGNPDGPEDRASRDARRRVLAILMIAKVFPFT